ncbi:PAS domain-containing protein [Thalassobius sp. Cn5-15]|uniref:PAS domain-containing protein n=1 Tax=Thalassobius sp. Cn5-15 TaxID=2917763 RepID=UPI001EF1E051|nr:PAS domain-containing protein [Thalassobius sp. Cn5-15]MCG7492005.1 PAS domain-containing protein [Thalassobius sp. Cn5-15]
MNRIPTDPFTVDHDEIKPVEQKAAKPATGLRSVPEVNVEEPFAIEDLFFSRTDKRGVIEAYNEVFVRIAGFGGSELQGAPHNIIRHSDMPKAVFWLLWNGLKNGTPVGAYVKNKTKSGKYYWVFAIASPLGNGDFLSVRLKPTSPLLGVVSDLYGEILHAEKSEALSPEDSANRMMGRIQELGFQTYAMFQAHALFEEFEARRKTMGTKQFSDLSNIHTISENASHLRHEIALLSTRFDEAALLIANMKIFAAKLPEGRSTINEIAKNYDLMLRDIRNHLKTLDIQESFDGIWEASRDQNSFFMLCTSHLLEEMCKNFKDEGCLGGKTSKEDETHVLNKLRNTYNTKSISAVVHGIQSTMVIQRRVDFLRRMILGLSTIRIACRVEAGTLRDTAKGLDNIVARLDDFHDEIEEQLEKIQGAVNAILKGVDRSILGESE